MIIWGRSLALNNGILHSFKVYMKLGTYSNSAMQRELFYLYKRSILIEFSVTGRTANQGWYSGHPRSPHFRTSEISAFRIYPNSQESLSLSLHCAVLPIYTCMWG